MSGVVANNTIPNNTITVDGREYNITIIDGALVVSNSTAGLPNDHTSADAYNSTTEENTRDQSYDVISSNNSSVAYRVTVSKSGTENADKIKVSVNKIESNEQDA